MPSPLSVHGCLGRKPLPVKTPGATLAGPPISATRGASRIMLVSLMIGLFVVATAGAALPLPRLAAGDLLIVAVLTELTAFGGHHSDRDLQGGFKRSSQHHICQLMEAIGRRFCKRFPINLLSGPAVKATATAAISWPRVLRSVPFGKYWRGNPLVFSLVPRYHGCEDHRSKSAQPRRF
jgi:hypothetical protein